MKKIYYITLTLILLAFFAACSPIEKRDGYGELITSADQLKATVTQVLVGSNIKTNKVFVHCSSPVICQWTDGVKTYISTDTALVLFVKGDQTITLTARAADGTQFSKDYSVTVDSMQFPVPPQYGYFCGSGEKTWTWADTKCFGNGHAYAWDPVNKYPEWWILGPSDVTDQCSGKSLPKEGLGATMKFTLKGLKMSKIDADGNVISDGQFSFDMTADSHNWAIGTLTLKNTNILCGYDFNGNLAPWSQYSITYFDNNTLVLGAQEHAPNSNYWFWVFKAQ